MKAIFCIATGSETYLQLALNLGLSIKANSTIDTVLLHTIEPLNGLKWSQQDADLIFGYAFDKMMRIVPDEKYCTAPLEQAHYIKLSAYQIAKDLGYSEVLILDSDTLVVPSKSPEKWFSEVGETNFTAYCNAYFDFTTGKQSKAGYTFWCEPKEAMEKFELTDKMPQINASFIYFKISEQAEKVFQTAKNIWETVDESGFEYEKYNGSKTEEMCLNIACAIHHVYPHKIPFQPVYFQYQHEEHSPAHVAQYYIAMSMAGNIIHTQDLCAYYNQVSRYYRTMFGINYMFQFSNETKKPKDSPIKLPYTRRTLWRRGELPNSEAGIFNPSGVVIDGELSVIYRKEKSMEIYSHKYTHSTAIPHYFFGDNNGQELDITGFEATDRLEDFRFINNGNISHTVVTDMTNDTIFSKIAISEIVGNKLKFLCYPELPIKTNKTEKNWIFFQDSTTLWCIYSLNPYRIFYINGLINWREYKVADPKLKWWQHNKYICNSTNPILIDGYYFVMFHTKDAGIYSHGCALIDAETKEIKYYLRNGLKLDFNGEGFQKNLLYVSGAVYLPDINTIRIFAGEGDAHAIYFDFNKDILMNEIKRYKA